MTRADRYLIAGVLCVALLAAVLIVFRWQTGSGRTCAVIKIQGELAGIIELSDKRKTYEFRGKTGPVILEVAGKRIRMVEATCPDRICVMHGWIERAGESIVCVPNEISISITANGSAPLDAVTR